MQQQRRSRFILGLLSLGLLTGVALTANSAQAVDAVGPYYALPSWDRKMVAVNRFVVLTNWNSEAVLDKETGLVWELSPANPPRPFPPPYTHMMKRNSTARSSLPATAKAGGFPRCTN